MRPISSRDHGPAGQDRDVAEHLLAPIAEARGLDAQDLDRAAQLVHDERGERLAVHVLGDDQERLADGDRLLERGQDVRDRRDLLVGDQDAGVVEDGLHPVGVGDEVGGDVAAIELHPLRVFLLEAERLALLDGDDAVLADLVHHLGDDLADLGIRRGDGRDGRDLLARADRPRRRLDLGDDGLDGALDAVLEHHRVRPGGHVAEALADDRLAEDDRGGRAVAGDVVGLGGDLLEELRAHVLEGVLELDVARDRHAVVGDGGRAELLVEDDVAALGADRHLDRVGELVDAAA